jgi:hypothetical protein
LVLQCGKKERQRRTDFVVLLKFFGFVHKDFKDNIWISRIGCNDKLYEFRNGLVVQVLFEGQALKAKPTEGGIRGCQ